MKKFILSFITIAGLCSNSQAQSFFEFNNRHLSQSHLWNPGFMPQYKATLSVGQTFVGASIVGTTLNGLFGTNETPIETVKRLIQDKDKQLGLDVHQQTDLFHFGFRSKKSYFALNSTLINEAAIRVPKDLFGLAFLGNGAFIENDADIDFSGNRFRSYLKNTFSYGRFLTNELSVGVNASLINGITDFGLDKAQFQIGTDTGTSSIYSMNLKGALQGRASLLGIDVEQALNDSNFDANQTVMDQLNAISLASNQGYALGFGAVYRLNEHFRFSLAVQNIGSITWNVGAQDINLKESSWQWNGLDTSQVNNLSDNVAQQIQDTFLSKFEISGGNIASYTTALKPRYTLGAEFLLFPRTHIQTFGGYGFGINGDKSFVGANIHQEISEWIDLRVGYSLFDFSNPNHRVGVGFSLNLGPLQVFASMNDVLGVVQYGSATVTSGTVGLNINIGRRKDRDYDDVPDKRDSCFKTFGVISNDGCPYGFLGGSMNYDEQEEIEAEVEETISVLTESPAEEAETVSENIIENTPKSLAPPTNTSSSKKKNDNASIEQVESVAETIDMPAEESTIEDSSEPIMELEPQTLASSPMVDSNVIDTLSKPWHDVELDSSALTIDTVAQETNKINPDIKKSASGRSSSKKQNNSKKSALRNEDLDSLMKR